MLKSIDLENSNDSNLLSTIEKNSNSNDDTNNIDHFKKLQLKEQIVFIIEKMEIFTNINLGDKIGKYNNKYYLLEKGGLQKIKRWWYSENRNNTFNYLDTEFVNFFKLCNELKKHKFIKNKDIIKTDFLKLIDGLVSGLYNLKLTYSSDKNIHDISSNNNINNLNINNINDESTKKLICKIDSIILTLIDLKDDILKDINNSHPMEIQKQINHRLNKELNNLVNIKFSFP